MRKECDDAHKKLACCYRSYFRMTITPSRDGDAIVAPCWNNMFYPENKAVVKENIKGAWNSRQFRFQRKLISRSDWSFCKGASCVFDPFHREAKFLDDPDCKEAIALKKDVLAYTPKIIVINPSHACNCDCYFCFYVFMKQDRGKYRLKGDLLKEIEETLIPSAEIVSISGGEPFFAQESRAFIDRLIMNHPNKKISVNTNGTLLRDYGLDKIIENNLFLTITVYGMQDRTHEAVTKRNNRAIVFSAIQELIDRRYKRMQLLFLVSERSFNDSERFCEFIAGNEGLKGIVRNNRYEGERFWGLMRRLQEKYVGLASRLKFEYQDVSLPRIISRRLYNPIHSFRYLLQR